jgi:hypothetical protein
MGGQQTSKLRIAECGITSRVLGFKDSRVQMKKMIEFFPLNPRPPGSLGPIQESR